MLLFNRSISHNKTQRLTETKKDFHWDPPDDKNLQHQKPKEQTVFIFYGSCTTEYSKRSGFKQFTAGERKMLPVWFHRGRHTYKNRDLQEEINKFVKWGDENSPQVQFDQVQRYTVFREAAVFTSSASVWAFASTLRIPVKVKACSGQALEEAQHTSVCKIPVTSLI